MTSRDGRVERGTAIREARKRLGLSQVALANMLTGIDQATISHAERASGNVGDDRLWRIEAALDAISSGRSLVPVATIQEEIRLLLEELATTVARVLELNEEMFAEVLRRLPPAPPGRAEAE